MYIYCCWFFFFPPTDWSSLISPASKIDSLRSKVELLKLPLALSSKSISERKTQLAGATERNRGGAGVHKPRPLAPDMDNESQYSGYSYKSSHSRSSRKHRCVHTHALTHSLAHSLTHSLLPICRYALSL